MRLTQDEIIGSLKLLFTKHIILIALGDFFLDVHMFQQLDL